MANRAIRRSVALGTCAFLALVAVSFTAAQPPATQSTRRLLIVSDIHFDPTADPTLVVELAATDPGQWERILGRSKLTGFSQYGRDTNWWLLKSALDAMRKRASHPALVMVTGDLLAHNFHRSFVNATNDNNPEHYRSFVLSTVEFLAIQLRNRFRGTEILLTPGNNDDDCGDYSIEESGTFLSDTADVVRDLAKADDNLRVGWASLGSFDLPHPSLPGVRIISLNTVFWSAKYQARSFTQGCAAVNSTAAEDLFTWLELNLAEARRRGEKAWLMFHIPPGIDGYGTTHSSQQSCASNIVPMWVPAWTSRFDDLLVAYQDVVTASFAGHTHTDDFRIVHKGESAKAFVVIDPPISPIYKQNPGFRVVRFRTDGTLVDQVTYYLTNLMTASSKQRGQWKEEYDFSKEWKVTRLDTATLDKIDRAIANTDAGRSKWLKLYTVSSPADNIQPDTVRGLYCAIGALDLSSYQSCYCPSSAPTGPDH